MTARLVTSQAPLVPGLDERDARSYRLFTHIEDRHLREAYRLWHLVFQDIRPRLEREPAGKYLVFQLDEVRAYVVDSYGVETPPSDEEVEELIRFCGLSALLQIAIAADASWWQLYAQDDEYWIYPISVPPEWFAEIVNEEFLHRQAQPFVEDDHAS